MALWIRCCQGIAYAQLWERATWEPWPSGGGESEAVPAAVLRVLEYRGITPPNYIADVSDQQEPLQVDEHRYSNSYWPDQQEPWPVYENRSLGDWPWPSWPRNHWM